MSRTKKRREQTVLRTLDYPIDPPGGSDYAIKGIEKDLLVAFKARCESNRRSMRWVLLTLMHAYAKGEVQL